VSGIPGESGLPDPASSRDRITRLTPTLFQNFTAAKVGIGLHREVNLHLGLALRTIMIRPGSDMMSASGCSAMTVPVLHIALDLVVVREDVGPKELVSQRVRPVNAPISTPQYAKCCCAHPWNKVRRNAVAPKAIAVSNM
jgi:hypothetical protein